MKKLFICAAALASMVAFAEKVSAPAEGEKPCCKECKKFEQKELKKECKKAEKKDLKKECKKAEKKQNKEKKGKESSKQVKCQDFTCGSGVVKISGTISGASFDGKDGRVISFKSPEEIENFKKNCKIRIGENGQIIIDGMLNPKKDGDKTVEGTVSCKVVTKGTIDMPKCAKQPKIEKKMPPKPEMNREKFREMREKRAKEMSEKCAKEGIITPRAAIAAALAHAKLDRKDVRRIECELEREDGRVIYDVEFKKGRYEYDYDIDARTGAILKQKYELD